ncbi:MAG: hypothetical protein AAFX85_20430, partial [Pseudomonadota bacterium]
ASIVRPGPATDPGAYTRTYLNVNHEADPVSVITHFKAPRGWDLAGGYQDISLKHFLPSDDITDIPSLATLIHSAAHYMAHPDVHLRLLLRYDDTYFPTEEDGSAIGSFNSRHRATKVVAAPFKDAYEGLKNGDVSGLEHVIGVVQRIKEVINA